MGDICSYRKAINSVRQSRRTARERHRSLSEELKLAEAEAVATEEAVRLAQQVAQAIQQQAHDRIAEVVSRCLTAVFDEPYTFILQFERKRNRTEANMLFEREGMRVDPMTASGGGVIDVASFALRLSCLVLSKPFLRRVMIMDEPFKFVSEEYRERVRLLLETLSEEMGIQFIMVTHIQELKAGDTIAEIG